MLILVLAWYYFSRLREEVILKTRIICDRLDVQLLDQTVTLRKIQLTGLRHLRPVFLYEYRFEISHNGIDRCISSAVLRNRHIEQIMIYQPDGNTIVYDEKLSGII